jgi:hypothetical protein
MRECEAVLYKIYLDKVRNTPRNVGNEWSKDDDIDTAEEKWNIHKANVIDSIDWIMYRKTWHEMTTRFWKPMFERYVADNTFSCAWINKRNQTLHSLKMTLTDHYMTDENVENLISISLRYGQYIEIGDTGTTDDRLVIACPSYFIPKHLKN